MRPLSSGCPAVILFGALLVPAVPALGQDQRHCCEMGAHYSVLSLNRAHQTLHGGGFRLAPYIGKWVTMEMEQNILDGANRIYQGLFGIKAGLRVKRLGVFAKCRPGFTFGTAVGNTTRFALDLGGVAEVYSTRNLIVRFDLGDTILRSGAGLQANTERAHNLQFSAGVVFRFWKHRDK